MDWPFMSHSKWRRRGSEFRLGSIVCLAIVFGFLHPSVGADSSPPVLDVEDLFKDEGFLRMSRGGEAFGKRPPPPPLLGPLSTQPPRQFEGHGGSKPLTPQRPSFNHTGEKGEVGGSRNGSRSSSLSPLAPNSPSNEGTKPLEKDVNAVFSKVNPPSGNGGPEKKDSDHPLLGITPAAPGEAFDFNPILANPAVTRILAGSSGRMHQWEPSLSEIPDLISEGNYTGESNGMNRGFPSNVFTRPLGGGGSGNKGNDISKPVFIPSPVSPKSSPTMYNMDQMTNNIAIPKHTLSNPSNLATSRTTTAFEEAQDSHYGSRGREEKGGNEDRGEGLPYVYDEDDGAGSEELGRNYQSPTEVQGKRGIYKGDHQDPPDSHHDNGPQYIVCDALCGAWKHQCKLMGILFSITSVLCFLFGLAVLYSLHFTFKDCAPFSVILIFLFGTSVVRAFILLAGWFCAPDSRPSWLPILSTLPAAFFTIAILVALHLARFPFPLSRSLKGRWIFSLAGASLLPPLTLSLAAHLHPPAHAPLTMAAWIAPHVLLALVSLAYLFKFKPFYSRLASERGTAGPQPPNGGLSALNAVGDSQSDGLGGQNNNLNLKKRSFIVKWGCLQARAMFGASFLSLTLSVMIIISVAMVSPSTCPDPPDLLFQSRGECEVASTWTGWVLSLCARMLEFAIVILLLLVTISSADIRMLSRLTRVPLNKSNVGLINADIFPTMVSSNTAVQRCIPTYSSNSRADVMMLGPTESRSSLRGKTFGERALPGERVGEYRSSMGRGLPLRLGNGPSHSLPGTPVDGFPQGLRLPEPAPASLLVTKVVFGTPAVSREVNHNHQGDSTLMSAKSPGSKEEREMNNIYASLESVKLASMMNAGSSTGSNHSGSDRVLLSAPRDYIYSISRDLTKTIDSIYDTARPRSNNLAQTIEALYPPLAHTIEQIGSIPNMNGVQGGRSHYNLQSFHPMGGNPLGRTDLARTIDRIRYGTATSPMAHQPGVSLQPGRNFVFQLGSAGSPHLPVFGNPPPYCSSESSHDVTPDSGIVSDIHPKINRMDIPEVVYARECRRSSVEDVRRLPPIPKQQRGPNYDRAPAIPGTNPRYATSPQGNGDPSIVGRVEHLLNQTEHILSRTESLDSNSPSAGLQRLLSHKEQLEHVERLLAQAEYAIWLEKRNCAQQVNQMSPTESPRSYGHNHPPTASTPKESPLVNGPNNHDGTGTGNSNSMSSQSNNLPQNSSNHFSKKISKNLEEESVV